MRSTSLLQRRGDGLRKCLTAHEQHVALNLGGLDALRGDAVPCSLRRDRGDEGLAGFGGVVLELRRVHCRELT